MSDDPNNKEMPNNDVVIEELTKDLEAQCIPDENEPEVSDDFDGNKPPEVPDDYIDEDALKDLETTLSPEEIDARHARALELKNAGNDQFKQGEYLESITTYTAGLQLCPLAQTNDRSILYSNRAASKIKLDRNKSALDDCSKSIELNDTYQKAIIRRAKLYEELDKLDESLADWKKINEELDPSNQEALDAVRRLPPIINERNEKLKTEMLGKLKEIGNMFLKPFGLSTNNFNMQQDPNTGSYSVNFQQ